MSKELHYFKSNISLPNLVDSFLFRHKQSKEHPEKMPCDGLICFCGEQGSGKTLSAVNYVYNLARDFPKSIICTNVELLFDLPNTIIPYEGPEQMLELDNGEYGIIFFLDEIHIEFNSLESKGMDTTIFELVSQQRKARKHIVGTAQVFARMAKPFREQFKYAVCCDNFMSYIFRQQIFSAVNVAFEDDIRTELHSQAVRFFIPSPKDFERYDTSQIIKRIRGVK